jgi:type II secretory pathway component GspD/PulD (secretin)
LLSLPLPALAQRVFTAGEFQEPKSQGVTLGQELNLQKQALASNQSGQEAAKQVPAAAAAQAAAADKVKPADKKAADSKTADKKGSDKNRKAEPPKTIKRPQKFDGEADPKELELKPNAEGRLRFNFTGQPWPGVLQWLADTSKLSLQWEELPGGFLTLITQRAYTVDEARDLINKQLLARGYTMLLDGELLYVVPIAKINKAMIPRVLPKQLADRQPHEFVRCSFRLDWLVAGDAVTELKPMLSEHGKLQQLASTNRIEAFDIVRNLRAINQLIEEEQSDQVEEGLVRQFVIKHRRAEEVMRLVQRLMGINPDNPAQPMSSAQMKQIQKAIAAAQKAAKGTVARQPVPTVMVLNQPENSILVTAEPDKMKQIEQAILQLDVPKKNGALLGNMARMKIYRLNTYDPAPLVKLLEDLGELDPQTQLTVDKENKSIMAYASLADHLLIGKLIEKVDGLNRTFSVIQLQKRDAEEVAGTVKKMMGVEEDDNNNDYYYYRSRSSKDEDKFMVEADVEKNQLLLKANPTELTEIKNLLRKLGEDPDQIIARPRKGDRIRVYDIPAKNAEEVLERLRKLWPLDNKLEIDIQDTKPASAPASTARKTTRLESKPRYQHTVARPVQQEDPVARFFNGADGDDQPPTPSRSQGPAPVRISIRNGQLIVTSDDPVALQEVNNLLEQLLPAQLAPAEDYKIYTMQHVSPFWMAGTLEDFFDIDTGGFFYYGPPKKDKASLGKKKEMRFVTDSYTKTLVVLNATLEQHATIQELIDRMDQPEQTEARLVRVTQIFQIKHSQATAIQNVIKEVYRDLLSGNDKALQEGSGEEGGKKKGGGTAPQFFGSSSATYLTEDEDEKVKFTGQLSVSADPLSNTLTVSGTASLVKDIGEKIEILDVAAKPASNMRVVPVSKNITPAQWQRLEKLISPQAQPQQQQNGKNPQQGGQQQQQRQQPNSQGRRGRNR